MPGVDLEFQDLKKINEDDLSKKSYQSQYYFTEIVCCITQIKAYVYMYYYLNSLYDSLVRNYKNKPKCYIEPSSQDMAITLKTYDNLMWILNRYSVAWRVSTFNYTNNQEGKDRHNKLQYSLFPTIFSILQAIAYKNEKMQKIMWKHKEFFTFSCRGLLMQFGELDLLSMLCDNKSLLLRDTNLDQLSDLVLTR